MNPESYTSDIKGSNNTTTSEQRNCGRYEQVLDNDDFVKRAMILMEGARQDKNERLRCRLVVRMQNNIEKVAREKRKNNNAR